MADRSGYRYARLDSQVLAYGQDVQSGIIQRPLKINDPRSTCRLWP